MPSLDQLNAKLDGAAEGAEPWGKDVKDGDQVAGRVVARGSFTHAEYGTSATLTIDTTAEEEGSVVIGGKTVKDHGTYRVLMAGAVLGSFVEEQDPQSGDWIALRYTGRKSNASGTMTYKSYATVCEKPTANSKLDDAAGAASDFA